MVAFDLSYKQLLLYGVHIGHGVHNTLIYSAWMVSAFRQSTSIINLMKSLLMFKLSFLILSNVVIFNGPIWFINLDSSIERYVASAAVSCGEFHVTSRWVRGTISNYVNVFNSYRRLSRLSNYIFSAKYTYFKRLFNYWYLSRYSWPRVIFISSLYNSYFPANEALSLKIPSICIVDTNVWSQVAPIAIPGNDESINCLIFYNDLISNFILCKKFNLVSAWFFNIRSSNRVLNFVDWLCGKYNASLNDSLDNLIYFKPNFVNNLIKSSSLFLSLDYWSKTFKDNLDMFYVNISSFNMSRSFSIFMSLRFRFLSILNFYFFKKFWSAFDLFDHKFLTDKFFNLKFLAGNSFFRNLSNYYYFNKFLKYKRKFNNFFVFIIPTLFFFIKYLGVRKFKIKGKNRLSFLVEFVSLLLYDFVPSKTLWARQDIVGAAFRHFKFIKKDVLRPSTKLSSSIKFSLKNKSSSNSVRFFVSDVDFSRKLPNSFWFWHKNRFVPNYVKLHPFFKGYFYSQPLKRGSHEQIDINYLNKLERNYNLLFLRNGCFFFLGSSNSAFIKDFSINFNRVDWFWF